MSDPDLAPYRTPTPTPRTQNPERHAESCRQMTERVFTELEGAIEQIAIAEKRARKAERDLHRLERAQSGVDENSPGADQVQELLDLWWVVVMGSHPNVAHSLSSTRAVKVRAAIRRRTVIAKDQGFEAAWGFRVCRKAILGVVHDDWAMGRVAKSGGKKFNDIAEHVLNTDGDIERFAGLCDAYRSHITEKPLEPEVVQSIQTLRARHDRAELDKLQRQDRREREDPLEAVLSALTWEGWDWRCRPKDGWEAQCPAHNGEDRKLWIDWNGPGDKLLLKCWSHGCEVPYVMDALGLPLSSLFRDAKAA